MQLIQRKIALMPLSMSIPNSEGIYSLSQYEKPLLVTEKEWRTCYISTQIKVGTPDNWRWVMAYSKGLLSWYIAVQ